MKFYILITVSALCFFNISVTHAGNSSKAKSLDDLLSKVKTSWKSENQVLIDREAEFMEKKEDRQRLLQEAEVALAREQHKSESLEKEFDQNKVEIENLKETLKTRLGTMGELFGVIRQIAGDTRSQVDGSIVNAQFPGRGDSLKKLATSKSLPSIEQLEHLWYILHHEMTQSGKVARFSSPVVVANGDTQNSKIVRVGVFNAVAQGKFLTWMPDLQKLVELKRQPISRYQSTAEDLEEAKSGYVSFAIDPSRGAVLSLLVQTPGFAERIHFGGVIGYIVICIGILTFIIALYRLIYLSIVNWKVQKQRTSNSVGKDNPLGRIIHVFDQNRHVNMETLELKLDEAIIRESSNLDRLLWAVKVASVVAPLLGLLGTVTGMIRTFQAITLFGTGDPKLMAGGISEALVTTMLGLCVAIPLVLMHSGIKSMSKRVVEVLEEQSAGIIAKRAEQPR